MLCEVPLTKEQQEFAAEHHGLVYKFLNDNHLPEDEFYDVVIFPYLKAVQDYFSDEDNLVRKNLWSIVEIAGSRWLVHINHWYGIYFGG